MLTDADCKGSQKFIAEFINGESPRIGKTLACGKPFSLGHTLHMAGELMINSMIDCGAGIGRVSKHFLLHTFDRVDLVEQNPAFLEQAKKDFEKDGLASRVERYIPLGLQSFIPEVSVCCCDFAFAGHKQWMDLV